MLKVDVATKYYNDQIGIERLSFDLKEGEVVGLFGENGSGKTTLIRAMMHFIQLNIGDVTIDGEVLKDEVYKKITLITNENSFFPYLTVRENGEFFNEMFDNFSYDMFLFYVDYFKLDLNKKAKSMSTGQKTKLELALGLSKQTKYILMDEPFMGKDIFTRKDFLKVLISKMNDSQSMVIATHLVDEVKNIITRAVYLKEGRKVRDMNMDEINKKYGSLMAFLKDGKEH